VAGTSTYVGLFPGMPLYVSLFLGYSGGFFADFSVPFADGWLLGLEPKGSKSLCRGRGKVSPEPLNDRKSDYEVRGLNSIGPGTSKCCWCRKRGIGYFEGDKGV